MAEVYGIEVGELPEGWTPVEAIVIVKCHDLTDGDNPSARLALRASEGLNSWEAIGMVRAYEADLLDQFLRSVREAGEG